MRKVIKKIAILFMVCGLAVNMSFGVDLCNNEENYQKLKAEVAEYGGEECKWSEDGKKIN